MPAVDAEAMNRHLLEISTRVTPGAHAVLVCDGAGWHQTGGGLRVPDNITLLPLPPYAPELNPMENARWRTPDGERPMENVWEYLRANKLCDLVRNGYKSIVDARKNARHFPARHFPIEDPERIRSIGSRDWACAGLQAGWYWTDRHES